MIAGAQQAEHVEDHYARAAEQALARAQTLSVMLTGETLAPRLEVAVPDRGRRDGREPPVGPGTERLAPGAPSAALGLPRLGHDRGPAGDRSFWIIILVPLVVFAGMLIALLVAGDGTATLLAMGAVVIGLVCAIIPAFFRGGARQESDPRETKEVLDVMAGAIMALRGDLGPPPDGDGDGDGPGGPGERSR